MYATVVLLSGQASWYIFDKSIASSIHIKEKPRKAVPQPLVKSHLIVQRLISDNFFHIFYHGCWQQGLVGPFRGLYVCFLYLFKQSQQCSTWHEQIWRKSSSCINFPLCAMHQNLWHYATTTVPDSIFKFSFILILLFSTAPIFDSKMTVSQTYGKKKHLVKWINLFNKASGIIFLKHLLNIQEPTLKTNLNQFK